MLHCAFEVYLSKINLTEDTKIYPMIVLDKPAHPKAYKKIGVAKIIGIQYTFTVLKDSIGIGKIIITAKRKGKMSKKRITFISVSHSF